MIDHRQTTKNRIDDALEAASPLRRKVRLRAYKLTAELMTEHGGSVVCIDERAIGKHYKLFAKRPDASLNRPVFRSEIEANVIDATGNLFDVSDLAEPTPKLVRVDISGPIEQRAGHHECDGWSDGHDAIEERLIVAMQTSDVLLVIDSPGGAHAGMQERIRNVVREKAVYGRRITVFADEMIGSAAYWWAACVGDEIYGPEAALIGSIGARAGHQSIAGALAREGVETTYFAWPSAGKVAFAPELPLSDLGRQRGDRDVAAAGESFAAAVGPRRGLTRDEIVDLDADVLSGFAAVRAKLSDGVASYDEVLAYALALAESDTMSNIRTEEDPKDPKTPEELRAEEPQKPGHPEPDGDKPEPGTAEGEPDGDEPEGTEPKKAFCAYCGNKLEGAPKPEDEGDDPDEDKDEPKPEQNARASASVASVFGLSANASVPAVKSVAIAFASLGKAIMSATGTKSPREAIGAFKTLVDEASEVASLRTELKSMRKTAAFRERMDLLTKLASAGIPGYTRGELIVDKESGGNVVSGPSALYAKTDLETLRGLVESKLKSGAPRVKANPFEPNRAAANQGKLNARATTIIEQNPGFIQEAAAHSTATPDKLAQSAAALESAGMFQS